MLRLSPKMRNQRGITSIVVVFVLVVLLTLIGIGFTKIINRSLQSSAASQQATAANYAAQSGVNDVLSYLKTNPDASATKCDDLIKTGAPLANAANISGDGSTGYTCVLVDPNPTSLFYQSLNPYKSQIVKITTSTPLSSLLFSWQSPNRQQNQLVAPGAQTLFDEKTWSSKNYAPLLRVTLYPIPAGGDLSGVQAASKTFFLYPQVGGSNTLSYGSAGDTSPVNCASKNIGSFVGSADYDCNLVINGLPGASYYYARFTPYYDQAAVKIKGNDSSPQPVQFKNVQSVVDVTAKSGGATKRLQARVDTSSASGGTDFNISSGSDNAPDFALSTADTLCKRLTVTASTVSADDPNCNPGLAVPSSGTASLVMSWPGANGNSMKFTWSCTGAPSRVWASIHPPYDGDRVSTVTRDLTGTSGAFDWGGPWVDGQVVDGTINCVYGSTTNTDAKNYTVGIVTPPPGGGSSPSVSLSSSPTNISSGGSSTLTWTSSNVNVCAATLPSGWTSQTGTSGSQAVSPSSTTTYTISCNDGTTTVRASATVTIGSSVPPAPTCSITFSNWNPPDNGVSGQHYTATFNMSSSNATSANGSLSYYDGSSGGSFGLPTGGSAPLGDFYYDAHRSGHIVMNVNGPGGSGSCDSYAPWLSPITPSTGPVVIDHFNFSRLYQHFASPPCDGTYPDCVHPWTALLSWSSHQTGGNINGCEFQGIRPGDPVSQHNSPYYTGPSGSQIVGWTGHNIAVNSTYTLFCYSDNGQSAQATIPGPDTDHGTGF